MLKTYQNQIIVDPMNIVKLKHIGYHQKNNNDNLYKLLISDK